MTRVKEIDLQQMPPLRETSQKLSNFLRECLTSYLTPLAQLLAPQRVLGEQMEGSKEWVRGAAESFKLLEDHFSKIFRETFELPGHLASPVPAIKPKLKVYPWEYHYELGGDAAQTIIVSSPVCWVIAYDYPYTLHNLLRSKLAKEKPQASELKQMVINTLTMWLALDRQAGVKRILGDLRFSISVAKSPVSGELPFMVATSSLASFRPQDDVTRMVTQLSGRPVFEELIDPEEVRGLKDPLAEKLQALIGPG